MSTQVRNVAIAMLFAFTLGTHLFAQASTGTLTLGGTEQLLSGGAWDSGTETIMVKTANGSYSETVHYGQFSTAASVASALAATFSQDCNSPVMAKAVGAQITFRMRGGATTLLSLQLSSSGSSFSSAGILVNTAPQPLIFSVQMTVSNGNVPITLNGINFGSATGSVLFTGVSGLVSATTIPNWTATSITVNIPSGAVTGPVAVKTASGLTSNAVSIVLTEAVSCPAQ